MWVLNHILLGFLLPCVVYSRMQISIGAIFDENNEEAQIAFKHAVYRENIFASKFSLVPIIQVIDTKNTYLTEQAACSMLSSGVAAIFESPNEKFKRSGIVASICNEFNVPHLTGHWEPEKPNYKRPFRQFTRNFFPSPRAFSRALADIIEEYDWKSFTVIYEDDYGLIKLHDILQYHDSSNGPITVRRIDDNEDQMPLLKEIAQYGETRLILDCSLDRVITILSQAKKVKLLEDYQNYIVTTIDAHTLDFASIEGNSANITTFRIIDPGSVDAETIVHDWKQDASRGGENYEVPADKIKTESALMYDALKVFASSLRDFSADNDITVEELNCLEPSKWSQGEKILQILDKKSSIGITNQITFNEMFERNYFVLDVIEYSSVDGVKKIAIWNPDDKVKNLRTAEETYAQISQTLQNKTLIVTSRIGLPHFGYKKDYVGTKCEGNHCFEGYAMDLIDEISKILHFKYEFRLVPNNAYGSYNKETKKWDGLVKELLDHNADLAICDLTITYMRRSAVDFSSPFMTVGISILYKKPEGKPQDIFSFKNPLSAEVWLYVATAYLIMTLALLLLSRMAADDWEPAHPCDENPEELENIWSTHNCIWLTVGSIMQQGCDILPKAASTRIALSFWFFFALIVISSYTANLAAFLTSGRMGSDIKSAEDLAKQNKIRYGAVAGGSTLQFFKNSNFSTYQRMWSAMESMSPSPFVANNDEGIERVLKGNYAFLMESSQIEYFKNQNCNLTQIGGLLDSKGYGVAMPVNSPWRTHISQAILKLQEEGKLRELKDRWWIEKNGGELVCNDDEGGGDTPELGMDNVGGVFIVVGIGLFIAFIIGIIDFLWNIRQIAIDEKITPHEALVRELKFVMDIRKTKKPVGKGLDDESQSSRSNQSDRSLKSAISKESIKAGGGGGGSSRSKLDRV